MDEEILTGLRNAIEQGESLQEAMQVMINSGYGLREVQEASKFIGGGILESHQSNPDEQFVFPEKKSFFQNLLFKRKDKNISPTSSLSSQMSSVSQMQEPTITKGQFSKELDNIKQKQDYTKEIFLVVTLLVLVGILITTILLKNMILGWFS
ncbi:MAG: hypothetical protein AABW67_06045 [Nanoarchaeota archaeon]